MKTTKKEIIESALQLLKTEGAESLTQTKVAKKVGVSQGHLTYYFPKKNDLWEVVALHGFKELQGSFEEKISQDLPVGKLIESFSKNRENAHMYMSLCLRAQIDQVVAEMLHSYILSLSTSVEGKYGTHGQMFLVLLWGIGVRELAGQPSSTKKFDFSKISRCFEQMNNTL